MFSWLYNMFSSDMGIDLGTANTLVYVKGEGIVLAEPSVVAIEKSTGNVIAVGNDAKRMLGKVPNSIAAIRPMRDGVIADFETVEKMIRYFINKVHNKKTLVKPRIAIGIPTGITEVERRAVRESCEQAGARTIFLIEQARAAAIGADMPINEPHGNMIIEIGGGTTEVAVLSLGSMVRSASIRVGGDELDDAIIKYMQRTHNLYIGEKTAEEIKINIGHAYKGDISKTMDIRGRDLGTGLPKTITVHSSEMLEALIEPAMMIVDAVHSVLEKTPPELAADISDKGIYMTGGGCLIDGLDRLLQEKTGINVMIAEDAISCVAKGTGKALDNLDAMDRMKK